SVGTASPPASTRALDDQKTSPLVASSATEETAAQAARAAAMAAMGRFSNVIAERLAILEAAATDLQANSLSAELQHSAQQAAHKLAGSLGMFGLTEGSHLSQEIETCLQAQPPTVDADQISTWISQLRHDIEATLQTTVIATSTPAEETTTPTKDEGCLDRPPAIVPPGVPLPMMLVVATNPDWLSELQTLAQNTLRVLQAGSLLEAQHQLVQARLDTVLLDLEATSNADEVQIFLTNVTQQHPNASILILMQEDTFEARLEIASYCSCTFLPRLASITQIVNSVVENYRTIALHTFHVLVVDDDPVILNTLEQQLPPWGLRVTTLDDPRQLWDVLPQLKPDLLMLDVEMPHVDGIQLCKVVRSDRTWGSLPILFLTARRDAETVQQIFQAGADDYIAKPFAGPELVTRILNRLERQRLARKLAVVNPVTGLITEQQALRDISRDLAIAQRYRQPYCLAMIGVEVCSPSAKQPQPWLEEQAVSDIANILSQKLRCEDLITQSSSKTFLLGLYGIHKQHATGRLKRLTQAIRIELLQSLPPEDRSDVLLSFQIGLAAAPEDSESVASLYRLAEQRLHPIVKREPN
ncbi:MAG: response regulator, partial [Cyanobacteria bacterium J06636_16]